MKTIFTLCGLILIAGGFYLWHTLRLPSQFGTFSGAPKVEVADIVAKPTDYLHKSLTIEGIITKQCTTMGCYFFFDAGNGKSLRVDLAEIAMNAPKNKNGHRAIVEGQVVSYQDGYQFWASAIEFK